MTDARDVIRTWLHRHDYPSDPAWQVANLLCDLRAAGWPAESEAEVAELRAQVADEQANNARNVRAHMSAEATARDYWRRLQEGFAREDALAGQVAAIRALHVKVSECYRTGYDYYCAVCITAPDEGINEPWPCPTIQALDSLAASSPTTADEAVGGPVSGPPPVLLGENGCDYVVLASHVGPFSTDDGGCGTCAECDYDANHAGPCDCGHQPPGRIRRLVAGEDLVEVEHHVLGDGQPSFQD